MTKKATTIVLFFVVIFLLASTVYVSIILTADPDASTAPRDTKASEIGEELTVAEGDSELGSPPIANDTEAGEPPADTTADTAVPTDPETDATDTAGTGTPADPTDESTQADTSDDDLLAYANPSPTGAAGTTEPTAEPTRDPADGTTPSTSPALEPTVADLPETGLGQGGVASTSPTMAAVTAAPTQPVTLPVAGSVGMTALGVLVAGATIVVAFVL
jgi:hypothetical protein